MKNSSTKKLAAASVLSALGVLILLIGSFVEVADLSAAAIASFVILFAVYEFRGAYPLLMWVCISLLGLLLLPSKLPALYFAVFFGWYPILKRHLERLPIVISWALKTLTFAISFVAAELAGSLFIAKEELLSLSVWICIGSAVVFVLFDIALSRICIVYHRIWKQRFNIKF